MDYSELMFAATLREVAKQEKQKANTAEFKDWQSRDRAQLDIDRETWDKEHPVINYVPAALRTLETFLQAAKADATDR